MDFTLINSTLDIPEQLWPLIIIAALWSFFWKGLALWHAARNSDTTWFLIFLLINVIGILEIIYLAQSGRLKRGKLFAK